MTSLKKVVLRYGSEDVEIFIPEPYFFDEIGMRKVIPASDPSAVIEASLDAPIGTGRLEDIAVGSNRVVILVDDLTRPTPIYQLMPSVLRRIEKAKIQRDQITILVATGTHRPMTREELEAKIGVETLSQYKVVNHDYRKKEEQVSLGKTPSGIPITVNKSVAEADFVIALGNIVPHRYCGWAGGAKIIQPGVGGEATTAGTHLMITKDPGARLGVVENKVRHEMEVVASHANLKFIVNTILDRYANIVEVVVGDFRAAFRKGVEKARKVYSAPIKGQADIVIASAYPSDINFWQAGKALYSADLVVKNGGIIILASPCYEGVGKHKEFVNLLKYKYDNIEKMIENGRVKDRISAAAALAVALVTARSEIWLVSSTITDEQARKMNVIRYDNLQAAIESAIEIKGEACKVTVMHEATEILPILPSGRNDS